jgi:hypothetical protein
LVSATQAALPSLERRHWVPVGQAKLSHVGLTVSMHCLTKGQVVVPTTPLQVQGRREFVGQVEQSRRVSTGVQVGSGIREQRPAQLSQGSDGQVLVQGQLDWAGSVFEVGAQKETAVPAAEPSQQVTGRAARGQRDVQGTVGSQEVRTPSGQVQLAGAAPRALQQLPLPSVTRQESETQTAETERHVCLSSYLR